jgi:hypothetical protein
MVILLAGLGTIPEELLDAARVDGASYPQRLRRVSLPLLSPFPTVRAMNVLTTSTPPEWMLLAAVILFTILLLRLGKALDEAPKGGSTVLRAVAVERAAGIQCGMTGRQKIQQALSRDGTPEIPVVICYEEVFVRDHWGEITREPW